MVFRRKLLKKIFLDSPKKKEKKIEPKTLRETFKTKILLKLNENFQINLHNCGVNFNLYYNILNLFDRLSNSFSEKIVFRTL